MLDVKSGFDVMRPYHILKLQIFILYPVILCPFHFASEEKLKELTGPFPLVYK